MANDRTVWQAMPSNEPGAGRFWLVSIDFSAGLHRLGLASKIGNRKRVFVIRGILGKPLGKLGQFPQGFDPGPAQGLTQAIPGQFSGQDFDQTEQQKQQRGRKQ